MSLRWGTRCVSCQHRRDAHWLHNGPCLACYCPRYAPPWWVELKNALRRWWHDRI